MQINNNVKTRLFTFSEEYLQNSPPQCCGARNGCRYVAVWLQGWAGWLLECSWWFLGWLLTLLSFYDIQVILDPLGYIHFIMDCFYILVWNKKLKGRFL